MSAKSGFFAIVELSCINSHRAVIEIVQLYRGINKIE